ncbi:serine/threonine protein kinase [Streptomyces sp. AV19]|uniref:serine/threonine-protein kinase n=1 Tax=Streptomyces sp. AV19 TaxID=2793068 RepID=UPI0018FE4841|nr:serine/threonine-protein kinase [Streptomyces sp. AV19]MBH1935989.1 serine/threonine protein kinase [Streptomyces sp. AV19]MDG4534220.1 serine/threonine protein kinase [Streptomyces sp. AV19]
MGSFAAHDGVIAGRYRLGRRIGRGGMGTVWRATDELLGREVAVKELHADDAGSPGADRSYQDRTLREARTVALIKHPNVIVLHDIVEQDGRPWIVMELVDGRSLSDRLAADGPVDPREAARIGLAMLGALRAAHARGVLHRDIKPPNVLLESGTGRVVLTDFGIAQVSGATTITETGAFVGSPEYTAPERMAGGQAGPESDLWSLGVLLCTALSGASPFHRDSLGGILHAVVYDEIRPPEAAGPLLPVVRGLLERDPARRMGTDEAERLLRGYLDTGRAPAASVHYTPTQSSVPAPALTPPPAPARAVRVRTALLGGVALVTLAGLGAGVAALLMIRDEDGRDDKAVPRVTRTVTGTPQSPRGPALPTASATPPPAAADVKAPPGYRAVQDPAGFALAVPDGFTRSFEPPRVFYYSPGKEFRIGVLIQDPKDGGPIGVMRESASQAPDRYPGYRDARVTRTTHKGNEAASWEFTWNGFEDTAGPRHTLDLAWNEGEKMYDVWVSAPDARSDEGRRHFETALDTFVRTRPFSGQ